MNNEPNKPTELTEKELADIVGGAAAIKGLGELLVPRQELQQELQQDALQQDALQQELQKALQQVAIVTKSIGF